MFFFFFLFSHVNIHLVLQYTFHFFFSANLFFTQQWPDRDRQITITAENSHPRQIETVTRLLKKVEIGQIAERFKKFIIMRTIIE